LVRAPTKWGKGDGSVEKKKGGMCLAREQISGRVEIIDQPKIGTNRQKHSRFKPGMFRWGWMGSDRQRRVPSGRRHKDTNRAKNGFDRKKEETGVFSKKKKNGQNTKEKKNSWGGATA